MTRMMSQLAPTATVLVAVVYGVWPYLTAGLPQGNLDGQSSLPRIDPTILAPKLVDPVERNLFAPVGGDEAVAVALGVDEGPEPAELSIDPAAELASSLVLKATSVGGLQRSAVINGRLYVEGDRLEHNNEFLSVCTIRRIENHRVIVECVGHMVEITYPASPQ